MLLSIDTMQQDTASVKTLEVPGYQVMQYLGSGARSTIWSIRDRKTNELFVLKRVVKRHPSDHRFIEQAENEYAVASQIEHTNIRRCFQIRRLRSWMRTREVHLVMEFCPGLSVQQSRPTDVLAVLEIFIQVANGLVFMHRRGFVHADMKPNNIIVGPDGLVKVIDLGQSCTLGAVKQRIQGTPDFIAPEQVYRQPLDARTDVFNFGAALYWTLTGQAINTVLPKKTTSVQLVSELRLTPVDQLNKEVPPALAKLVADCVEFQAGQRPAAMQQVQVKLEMIQTQIRRAAGKDAPSKDAPLP